MMAKTHPALSCIAFLLLAVVIMTSQAEDVSPVVRVPGNVEVAMLVDGEHRATTGANRSRDNSGVLPVILAAVNTVRQLQRDNASLGLSVYDTSDPSLSVTRLLAAMILQEDTTPAAVITLMSPSLTSSVSDLLNVLNVLHVDLNPGQKPDTEQDRTQHPAQDPTGGNVMSWRARVQATMTLLEALDIRYFRLLVADNPMAEHEARLFRQEVHQSSNLCAVPSLVSDPSAPTVVVTGDGDNYDGNVDSDGASPEGPLIVVVGDGMGHVRLDVTRQTVLWLQEELMTSDDLDVLLQTDPAVSLGPFNASSCSPYEMATVTHFATPQVDGQPEPCLVTMGTVRLVLAVRDALVAVATEKNNMTSDEGSEERRADEHAVIFPERWWSYRVHVYGKGWQQQADNSSQVYTSGISTVAVPSVLLSRDVSSKCDVNCHLCDVCTPKMRSEDKVMVPREPERSSLLVVGLFPVHTASDTRGDCTQSAETRDDCTAAPDRQTNAACSVPNPVGMAAARAFMTALDNHKNRTPGRSTQGVTVSGMVLDSCGHSGRVHAMTFGIESCLHSYADSDFNQITIQPSQVVAYVGYGLNDASYDVSKLYVDVTDTSYSFGGGSRRAEFQHIARTLSALGWTMVTLVVSEDTMVSALQETFRTAGVCVEVVTATNHVATTVDDWDVRRSAEHLTSHSLAVVFLSDVTDTRRVLEEIASLNSSARMKYFLSPWNSVLAESRLIQNTAEIVLVTLPTLPLAPNFHTLTEFRNPWEQEFDRFGTARGMRVDKRVGAAVTQAVTSLLEDVEEAQRELCPGQRGVCHAMRDLSAVRDHIMKTNTVVRLGLEIMALRPQQAQDWVKMGEIKAEGEITLSKLTDSIPSSSCPAWCPQCLVCPTTTTSSPPDNDNGTSDVGVSPLRPVVYMPGDILVVGVLPMRTPGPRPFRCGALRQDGEEERAEQAFLFAVQTAQWRYSNLLPGVTVGGVLLDSCSHLPTALHMLGEFESCRMDGGTDASASIAPSILHDLQADEAKFTTYPPSPKQVVGYVIQDEYKRADVIRDTVRGLNKMAVVSAVPGLWAGSGEGVASESPARLTVEAVLAIFDTFHWRHVHVLTSSHDLYLEMAEYLVEEFGSRDVCVVTYTQLPANGRDITKMATRLADNHVPVVTFLPRADAVLLFRDGEVGRVARPWLVSMLGDDWLSTVGVSVPWGALLIDVQGKINDDFQVFLEQFSALSTPPLAPWWQSYLALRHGCQSGQEAKPASASLRVCEENPLIASLRYPSATASRMIRAVDSILHAVSARHKVTCPHGNGICEDLARDIMAGNLSLSDASFKYEDGPVSFTQDGYMHTTLSVFSYQPGQIVSAGTYGQRRLSVNTSRVLFFQPNGQPLPTPTPFPCPQCTCINIVSNTSGDATSPPPAPPAGLAREVWWEERGVFVRELWTWAVLAVALGGAALAIFVIFYVLFKVWQGALARRYIGLGLVLLASLILLFLATLPFLFSPSPSVCGLRYLYPAVAQCLVMGAMLVKLMALQDYRRIGLGGELSACNQALSLLFVVLVQVSVSVLWWIFKGPFLLTDLDPVDGHVKAACDFLPRDYVLTHSFVLFLVCLCAVYSVGVRKEKKNMGEARLLLTCCWTLVVLWVGWTPTLLLLPQLYAPVVCCGGLLATGWVVLLLVFVPKVRLVARLKYDLAKRHGLRNGYSVDTDFLYERPYSLPGTLTSTYSSIRTYPKSLTANFHSSLSY